MGNMCVCVCRQSDEDEAADALLDGFEGQQSRSPRPRGPPPPYQVRRVVSARHNLEPQLAKLARELQLRCDNS